MRDFVYLARKIRQIDPTMLVFIVIFSLLSALEPFIWVLVPARIIALSGNTDPTLLYRMLIPAGIAALVIAFTLSYLRGNYRMRMNNVRYHLIRDLMAYTLRMPYELTLSSSHLDRVSQAGTALFSPFQGVGQIILSALAIFGKFFALAGFGTLFASISPGILVVVAVYLLLTVFIYRKISKLELKGWSEQESVLRSLEVLTLEELQNPLGRKDILSFSFLTLFQSYIRQLNDRLVLLYQQMNRKIFGQQALLAVCDLGKDLFLFGWLIYLFRAGKADAASFYLIVSTVIPFVTLAQSLLTDLTDLNRARQQFKIYLDLEKENPAPTEISAPEATTVSEYSTVGVRIDIEDLCYRYPGAETAVFDHFNLHIAPGEKLAIVGENGSGKSTLIYLLCGLLVPQSGKIYFDGRDLQSLSLKERTDTLAVVFQDAQILPFSLRENISFAMAADEKKFSFALAQSGLDEICRDWPKSYDSTLLRILDDEGRDLSGGERQKLYLARALYREQSRFLILDEPTAALDALVEHELYREYGKICEGKTSIFVSHRLSSTKFADRVALMHKGQIIESGTHAELMAFNGQYAELFNIQALKYAQGGGEAEASSDNEK